MNMCRPWPFIGAQTMIDCSAGLSKSVACFWTACRRPTYLAFWPASPRGLPLWVCAILCMINNYKGNCQLEPLAVGKTDLKACLTLGVYSPNIWCRDLMNWVGGSMLGICVLGPRMFFSSCLFRSQWTCILQEIKRQLQKGLIRIHFSGDKKKIFIGNLQFKMRALIGNGNCSWVCLPL